MLQAELDALSQTVESSSAADIPFTPTGSISATTVQAAIVEAAAEGGGGGSNEPGGLPTPSISHPRPATAPWCDLDASTAAGADGATDVTSFPDVSGNARHGVAAGGQGMTKRSNVLNAKAVLEAAGAQYYTLPSMAAFTAATFFVVMKKNTDPEVVANDNGLWGLGTSSGGGGGAYVPSTDSVVYDDAGNATRRAVGNPADSLAYWNIYEVRSAPTGSGGQRFVVNGTVVNTFATNTPAFPAAPRIGSHPAGQFLKGRIARFVAYSVALSDADCALERAYLLWSLAL